MVSAVSVHAALIRSILLYPPGKPGPFMCYQHAGTQIVAQDMPSANCEWQFDKHFALMYGSLLVAYNHEGMMSMFLTYQKDGVDTPLFLSDDVKRDAVPWRYEDYSMRNPLGFGYIFSAFLGHSRTIVYQMDRQAHRHFVAVDGDHLFSFGVLSIFMHVIM